MGENEAPSQPVKPQLGLFDAVSIMIGIVIGTTIYKMPPLIFGSVSGPGWGLGIWVVGGILSLIGALCYAELASTYPRLGGDYVYLSRAFGSWAGFLFGWAQLAVVLTANIGMMSFIFGQYAVEALAVPPPEVLEKFQAAAPDDWQAQWHVRLALITIPADAEEARQVKEVWTAVLAILAVVALTGMNILGVMLGKWVQNLLSLLKVVGLGAIIWIGFSSLQPEPFTMAAPREKTNFGLALIFVLFAFGGWNDMAFVAAEMRNRKNIPRALILGTAFITAIYLAVNAAYILSLGFDNASQFGQPIAARVMSKEVGEFAAKAMSVLVMISALGAINGLIFTQSRIYSSLGADWSIFARLGRWHPRFGSPVWALLAQALVAILMILSVGTAAGRNLIDNILTWSGETLLPGTGLTAMPWKRFDSGFDTLLAGSAPVFWIFFLMTGLSLFALRERDRDIERPFSVPLFPLLPLIFCTTCVYMLYSALDYAKSVSLIGFVPLAIGIPLYYLSGRTTPSLAAAPAPAPIPVETPASSEPFPFNELPPASHHVQESAPPAATPPAPEVPAETSES
jgi:amino acid transporter